MTIRQVKKHWHCDQNFCQIKRKTVTMILWTAIIVLSAMAIYFG